MSGDQLFVQTDGVRSYAQIHDQVVSGLSQLTGAGAPEAAGVQTTHGAIAAAVSTALSSVLGSRLGTMQTTATSGRHHFRASAAGRPDVRAAATSRAPKSCSAAAEALAATAGLTDTGSRRIGSRGRISSRGRRCGHERGQLRRSDGRPDARAGGTDGRPVDAAAAGSRPRCATDSHSRSCRASSKPSKRLRRRADRTPPTTRLSMTSRVRPWTTHPPADRRPRTPARRQVHRGGTRRIPEHRTGARHLSRPAPARAAHRRARRRYQRYSLRPRSSSPLWRGCSGGVTGAGPTGSPSRSGARAGRRRAAAARARRVDVLEAGSIDLRALRLSARRRCASRGWPAGRPAAPPRPGAPAAAAGAPAASPLAARLTDRSAAALGRPAWPAAISDPNMPVARRRPARVRPPSAPSARLAGRVVRACRPPARRTANRSHRRSGTPPARRPACRRTCPPWPAASRRWPPTGRPVSEAPPRSSSSTRPGPAGIVGISGSSTEAGFQLMPSGFFIGMFIEPSPLLSPVIVVRRLRRESWSRGAGTARPALVPPLSPR